MNIIGPMFGYSGYAIHLRSLANELNKIEKCKIITSLPQGFEKEVNDSELEMIKRKQDFDTNLIITHPLYWRTNLAAKHNFVYLIFEGDKIPKWIMNECLNPRIEKIIVPSEHTYQALKNTFEEEDPDAWLEVGDIAGRNKVVVIPHGVDHSKFYPKGKDIETKIKKEKPFVFLANKGLRNMEDRGGIPFLIKAYLSEFKDENVELILKINSAYGIPNLLKMFPELKNEKPKVRVITENYSTEQLNDLYNECDVFVSPTRAEAFNLPVAEAMACKKPSITTAYGGQIDYVDNSNGWLIDYKLVEVKHEIEYEGVSWATPDQNHLRKLLRYAFEHKDEVLSRGKNAAIKSKEYSWENTANQIINLN